MLIQSTSSAAQAAWPTSDSVPVAVGAPKTQIPPVQNADKATKEQPTSAQLQSAVDSLNQAMKQNNANVEFSIDKDTKQTVIRVVESKTGDVIRQYPSEDVLAISRAIDHMQQQGLLLKQKA
ncbi:MAG: flagellar protein FlaG [Nitrosomonadales bacterium]|nr:flagellar protein FlaG [Nitrosomonadales bacterium]